MPGYPSWRRGPCRTPQHTALLMLREKTQLGGDFECFECSSQVRPWLVSHLPEEWAAAVLCTYKQTARLCLLRQGFLYGQVEPLPRDSPCYWRAALSTAPAGTVVLFQKAVVWGAPHCACHHCKISFSVTHWGILMSVLPQRHLLLCIFHIWYQESNKCWGQAGSWTVWYSTLPVRNHKWHKKAGKIRSPWFGSAGNRDPKRFAFSEAQLFNRTSFICSSVPTCLPVMHNNIYLLQRKWWCLTKNC